MKLSSRTTGLLGLLLFLSLSLQAQDTTAVVNWLKKQAKPLRTVEPGTANQDLAPVGKAIGQCRIVAMGEATHGTRDFFRMKHRVFEYLVQHKGFTVFGMEAPFTEGVKLNEYIRNGTGDPVAIIHTMYWCWETEEVLDLVQWMRAYNLDSKHQHKLSFLGFDPQGAISEGFPELQTYFRRVNPAYVAYCQQLDTLVNSQVKKLRSEQEQQKQEARRNRDVVQPRLQAVLDTLQRNRVSYTARSSREEWEIAEQTMKGILRAYTNAFLPNQGAQEQARDLGMLENVRWMLEQQGPRSKALLWAHNSHVNSDSTYRPPFIPEGSPTPRRLGTNLRKAYPKDCYIIGFEFNQGDFQINFLTPGNRPSLQKLTLNAAPAGTLAHTLAQVRIPLYFVVLDQRNKQPEAVRQWLTSPQKAHQYGGGMSPSAPRSFEQIRLTNSYDALIFVDTTHRAVPLPVTSAR
ncbi:erythromycin esterase family protein [Hymenobacter terrenus]|uniref:erythromycin esterase family protein n=1 Tax=Hymenobacter terrenus TaxID=1629124 RepID=UPI0006974260|nr:erythromycin esterase family protein [Hymenobacter terrenus]